MNLHAILLAILSRLCLPIPSPKHIKLCRIFPAIFSDTTPIHAFAHICVFTVVFVGQGGRFVNSILRIVPNCVGFIGFAYWAVFHTFSPSTYRRDYYSYYPQDFSAASASRHRVLSVTKPDHGIELTFSIHHAVRTSYSPRRSSL